MPTTTIARVRTVFTGLAGTPGMSNFYFDADTSSAASYQPFVADFWDNISFMYKTGLVVTTLGQVDVIDPTTGQIVGYGTGSDIVTGGSDGGDELPPATNGLIRIHTGVFHSGRELQGKCFVPYPTENANTAGVPLSTYRSTITDACTTLNDISHANGAWCVWSRTNGLFELVSTVSVWQQWAVLRSRRD